MQLEIALPVEHYLELSGGAIGVRSAHPNSHFIWP